MNETNRRISDLQDQILAYLAAQNVGPGTWVPVRTIAIAAWKRGAKGQEIDDALQAACAANLLVHRPAREPGQPGSIALTKYGYARAQDLA